MKSLSGNGFQMPTKRNQDILDLRRSPDKKVSKPLMEKRRRARINHSLSQLKALVIDPNTAEKSRQAKLEKADILELTVQHLHEIQRQQRTALMLEARHPKRKFEIGYSECAREVELFLSNFLDPQCPGLDGDFGRRLKDHLLKRLNDFKGLNPVAEALSAESSIDSSGSEPLSPPILNQEGSPLSMDSDETDTSDHSSLKKMLNYHDAANEGLGDAVNCKPGAVDDPMREDSGHPYSCQSVSSTTGSRPSEHLQVITDDQSKVEPSENDHHTDQLHRHSKESFENLDSHQSISHGEHESRLKSSWCQSPDLTPPGSSYSHPRPETRTVLRRAPPRVVPKPEPPAETCITPTVGHSSREQNRRIIEQIPLVPRQLANGDWALVLPASLVPTKEEESRPISAFRLVLPSSSNSPSQADFDTLQSGQSSSSSAMSSSVSTISAEEYCARFEKDSVERMDLGSPDSTQSVWRPW